jgi:hypothetical protein
MSNRLQIHNPLKWRNDFVRLSPKLNGVCHAIRSLLYISSTAYFYSVNNLGLIFWGISFASRKLFTLEKKIFGA